MRGDGVTPVGNDRRDQRHLDRCHGEVALAHDLRQLLRRVVKLVKRFHAEPGDGLVSRQGRGLQQAESVKHLLNIGRAGLLQRIGEYAGAGHRVGIFHRRGEARIRAAQRQAVSGHVAARVGNRSVQIGFVSQECRQNHAFKRTAGLI